MTPFAAHMFAHVFAEATPIVVRGDVEYLINRNESGWVITLFNNNGVLKPQQGMAQVDRTANVTAEVRLRRAQINRAAEWLSNKNLEIKKDADASEGVSVVIPPGGSQLLNFS